MKGSAGIAVLAVTSFLQASPARSTQAGLQLLHDMQNALGGAKNIAAVRDFEETIRAQAWDSAGNPLGEVRKRTRWIQTRGSASRRGERGDGAPANEEPGYGAEPHVN